MNRTKLFTILSAAIVVAILLGACTPPATPTNTPQAGAPTAPPQPTTAAEQPTAAAATPTTAAEAAPITVSVVINPAAVAGDIITAGSSTVFPLSEKMAEVFEQEGYSGSITVDSIGTGAGFERFCKTGETDISNASRAIKASEVEACKAIGREPLEFRVGTDALAVVVSKESPLATRGVTLEELAKVFNGDVKTWDQLDATLPKEKILIYSPGTDSGTFDYFVEVVLATKKEGLLVIEGAQFSEDDNVLVQGVEGSPYAIGYFGYAYYAAEGDKLAALPINKIAPSQATVDDGTYPLSRPLFIYSDPKIMMEKPQVSAFIGFYLQNVNEHIIDVGYFPAPTSAINAAKGTWFTAVADATFVRSQ